MFALFEITDKGSSWLGPLIASVILQQTGMIRPVLIYLLCAMVLPALLLHSLDLSEALRTARIGTKGGGEGGDEIGDEGGSGGGAGVDSVELLVMGRGSAGPEVDAERVQAAAATR
jgi:UMF1 family MFS transporter